MKHVEGVGRHPGAHVALGRLVVRDVHRAGAVAEQPLERSRPLAEVEEVERGHGVVALPALASVHSGENGNALGLGDVEPAEPG
jgi:hypothetical protein